MLAGTGPVIVIADSSSTANVDVISIASASDRSSVIVTAGISLAEIHPVIANATIGSDFSPSTLIVSVRVDSSVLVSDDFVLPDNSFIIVSDKLMLADISM